MSQTLLNIGVAGLSVNQTLLQVTGNNIANADIESYSRQTAEISTRNEQLRGNGYIGAGAFISGIDRVVDQFLITQLRLDTATFNALDIFSDNIKQVDSLLADDLSGLGPAIDGFFSAIESSAQDPTSEPARQVVLAKADSLVQRFITLEGRLRQQNESINEQLDSLTAQVTSLSAGIAELNQAIAEQIGRGQGAQPNQLLDQRDELLRQLAEIVNTTTIPQTDGTVNVFIGNGQPLVIGNEGGTLATEASSASPGDQDIIFIGSNGVPQNVTDFMSGGKLGGLLDFQEEVISFSLNSLGRISLALADEMNRQNALGIDLEGNLGGNIFNGINSGQQPAQRVVINSDNPSALGQDLIVTIDDVSELSIDDYTLRITGVTGTVADYTITNNTTGATVDTGNFDYGALAGGLIAADVDVNSASVDGFTITFEDGSLPPLVNDSFTIRPTRNAAGDIEVEMQRLAELAYAVPISANEAEGNDGNGIISPGVVFDTTTTQFATPGALSPEILIRFTSTTTYDVIDAGTNGIILGAQPFIPGQQNDVFPTDPLDPNYTGYQVQLSGVPVAGDEFTVGYNTNGSSDNRNATLLGQVRTKDILDGGSVSFENGYGSLIEDLGTRAAQADISSEAAQSLLFQSQSNRDSIAGVNLDEEASNLIKFEQAYNASAQIINVARQIFDTLLAVFR